MPTTTVNQQFLAQNANRRYPLADDASGLDLTEAFAVPNDFLVYLDLPVSTGVSTDPARFYVRYIGAHGDGYFIQVAYQPVSGPPVPVAAAAVSVQGFIKNTVYALGGVAPFDDTVGRIVIGSLDNINKQPAGFWEFSLENARLDPDAVRPIIQGVSALVCVTDGQPLAPLQGLVELRAGTNMQLVPIVAVGQDPVIVINAISGEGTVQDCVCVGDASPTAPILTINGLPPVDDNFNLVGSECISVVPIANGLQLVDTCAKPCCGCVELERITQDLERLDTQAASVGTFVTQLQTQADTFGNVVLGSKLNDNNCTACP